MLTLMSAISMMEKPPAAEITAIVRQLRSDQPDRRTGPEKSSQRRRCPDSPMLTNLQGEKRPIIIPSLIERAGLTKEAEMARKNSTIYLCP
jgi:hypothetical protein